MWVPKGTETDDTGSTAHYSWTKTDEYISTTVDGKTKLTQIIDRDLIAGGANEIARNGDIKYEGYHVSTTGGNAVDCKPGAKDRTKNCIALDVYVDRMEQTSSITYDTNDGNTATRKTNIAEGKTITETFYLETAVKPAFGYDNNGVVSAPVDKADAVLAKAGVKATIEPGTDGTPPSYTAGTPTAVTPGTPTEVTPGTPTEVTPGTPTEVTAGTPTVVEVTPGTPSVAAVPAVMGEVPEPGYKSTHVAVEFNVGGMTPHLGYTQKKMNGSGATTKVVHYGLSGSMGDTGMSYLLAARNVKTGDDSTTPWLINVSRSLGGGATAIFGYGDGDDGNSGTSRVGLHINF